MRRYCKGEPQIHAARIALHWSVEKLLYAREFHDLVKLGGDLRAPHAENCSIKIDVLAAGQLGVKARSNLEKRTHSSVDLGTSRRRLDDASEDLKERAL